MKHFSFRYLLSLALAMLLCDTAGTVPQTDAEQVLSSGEVYQADTIEQTEIDGKQTIIKTFELPPDADPEALRESAFAQGGYKFAWERTDKTEIMGENKKNAEETFTMATLRKTTKSIITAVRRCVYININSPLGEERSESIMIKFKYCKRRLFYCEYNQTNYGGGVVCADACRQLPHRPCR